VVKVSLKGRIILVSGYSDRKTYSFNMTCFITEISDERITGVNMRDTSDKTIWGHVEKLGKGTRANYDPDKKTITFCFNRDTQTSSEQLKTLRELLLGELKEKGYGSRIKYNGEVVADNIEKEDVLLVKKNHQLIIHLNKKQSEDKEKDISK
jgi:hypothetical protein